MAKSMVTFNLDREDAVAVLLCLRQRQDECRRVGPEFAGHAKFAELNNKLERVKLEIAGQIPSA